MKELGIYVHIPFCKRKCNYCDFVSFQNKNELIEKYIECLCEEVKQSTKLSNSKDYIVKTIYIGGGTPSLIESKYIKEIIKEIKKRFNVDENAEITIEVNPGTVTEEKLNDYYNSGINRLSIGLQSDNDEILKTIGRIHTYSEFLTTYKLARKSGFKNINIDLMLALPNQTLEILENTVNNIVKLEPEHISIYSLMRSISDVSFFPFKNSFHQLSNPPSDSSSPIIVESSPFFPPNSLMSTNNSLSFFIFEIPAPIPTPLILASNFVFNS